jgi:hypothetical protein
MYEPAALQHRRPSRMRILVGHPGKQIVQTAIGSLTVLPGVERGVHLGVQIQK